MQQGNQENNHISRDGRGIGLPMFFVFILPKVSPSSFFATGITGDDA